MPSLSTGPVAQETRWSAAHLCQAEQIREVEGREGGGERSKRENTICVE